MDLPLAPTGRPGRAPLRRPLATARPGLDYLRRAFVLEWEASGALGARDLADAFVQAAAGSPDEESVHFAVARWASRVHASTSS